MTKLLLAVLSAAALSGTGCAKGSRAQTPDESSMTTVVIDKVRRGALRLKTLLLASLVSKGMSEDEVIQILGCPGAIDGGLARRNLLYSNLGLSVEEYIRPGGPGGKNWYGPYYVERVSTLP
jgi:hypothetical protein